MDKQDRQMELAAVEIESTDEVAAWEEIAAGRYMPRRIRGSCRGRVLG